jgi:sugar phosphate isomerase/epimerase
MLGFKLPVVEEVAIAAKAGYQGVEPWIGNLRQYADGGGSLPDLKRRIADLGLTVENAIGFAAWIVDDEAQRRKGMEQMRRDMELIAAIGGRRIAAPPAGANNTPGMDLLKIAERYRELLELGRNVGVVPQLEIWGSSKTLSRPSQAALVAIETAHPDACLLLDVFHLYKSGAGFGGLRVISGEALHVIHLNDYPAQPPRERATDADRVFPGDGIAPYPAILSTLRAIGFHGTLSLEVFNREYWKRDPLEVARTGLERMRRVVQAG